ncbi:MAG TPA: cytochrome c biogenesis protein CcdA, partial [Pirellulales bacterium]|nr:cytochrome c biogenesis protein CcdA [Pirellulales bacterium]
SAAPSSAAPSSAAPSSAAQSPSAQSAVPPAIDAGPRPVDGNHARGSIAKRGPAAKLNPDEFKLAEVSGGDSSLIAMMGVGFLGGLLLNLMPCVLPVIGLKILSFVEQSGHSRRQAFLLNLWYSLGILAVFMVLATLPVVSQFWFNRQFGWGEQFSFVGFNVALSAIVFVMALSFLGVWEIPIPGFIGTGTTQQLAAKEGFWGALAKGAVTTVLATPCSGPFLGTALAFALVQPPLVIYLMFASIGLGMASPYLLFGAFPHLLRWLPRPGAWMETFKQVMGFVLLGTVVYLLTLVESEYVIPALTLCFGLWAGCWWIGRTPAYAPWLAKTRAWAIGMAVPTIVGIIGFHWLGPQPASALAWRPFSMQELADLTADQKTVMVDFTANWCPTCKLLDRTVLNTAATKRYIEENGIVPMVADLSKYPPEERDLLAKLGARFIPVVAIFPAGRPNEPIVLRDTYTRSLLLRKLKEAGPSKASRLAGLAANSRER